MFTWNIARSGKLLGILLLSLVLLSFSTSTYALVVPPVRETAVVSTTINHPITTDTTWTKAGSPYYINKQEFEIQSGATLTIEPGVQIFHKNSGKIHIRSGASLIARGTPDENILIDRWTDKPWKHIIHYAGSSSYYRYVDFNYGGRDGGALEYYGGTHVINNCKIRNVKRQGIIAYGSTVDLTIAGTLFDEIKIKPIMAHTGATLNVTGSTFQNSDDDWSIILLAYNPPATVSVSQSNFLCNHGIHNELAGSTTVDAENNYWGAGGPGGITMGTGVDYDPWLTTQLDRVGITTPPTTTFTVTPDPSIAQPPGTSYTFDASDTVDAEDYDSSLDFCWDWEDDGGGCDATTITANHSYGTGGWHTARLTVTDTDNLTGTMTQSVLAGYPPTATFTITQTTWAEFEFDASASSDVEDTKANLLAYWDWDGDGVWDTGAYSVTDVLTHTYTHLGRYWPTLMVEDTDGITTTASQSVDVIPLAASTTVSGAGGTLTATDSTVQLDLYTDTLDSDVISAGLVITHTPWLTVPYAGLPDDFTYLGFNLSAESNGQPVDEVTGTYTITVAYDYDYLTGVLGLPPFEDSLTLYHWSGSAWTPVTFTLDTGADQLVATVDAFGDFALVMDVTRIYLPLIFKEN